MSYESLLILGAKHITLKILQSSSFQLFFPACFQGILNIVLFSSSQRSPGIWPPSIMSTSQYRSLLGGSDLPLVDCGDGAAICPGGGGEENEDVDGAGDIPGIPSGEPGVPKPILLAIPLWCKNCGELACSK